MKTEMDKNRMKSTKEQLKSVIYGDTLHKSDVYKSVIADFKLKAEVRYTYIRCKPEMSSLTFFFFFLKIKF